MLHTSQGSGCNPFPAVQKSLDPFRTLVRALVRKPGDYQPIGCLHIYLLVCLFVYVFVCVSVNACVSLTSYSCLYVSLFLCVCLCVNMYLCVCLCRCGWCIYIYIYIYIYNYVSENVFVCVCLCPCTVARASLGLTLRWRGLLVHVYNSVACLDWWYPVECPLVVGFIHPNKHHHTAFCPAYVERREGWILGGQ